MLNIEKIKMLQGLKGMTQASFADELNITQSYLSYLLNGKRKGTIEIVSKMAKVLGVSTDDLIVSSPRTPFFQGIRSKRGASSISNQAVRQ